MSKSPSYVLHNILLILNVLLLVSCGGSGGPGASNKDTNTQNSISPSSSQTFIAGGGIKGPLAFALVGLYSLDTRFSELYDTRNPLATTTTDTYAQITDLPVPKNVQPPYILVIDGTNAIDRNTGQTPVIKNLVTIITKSILDAGLPVYATPYTTLAYQMLRLTASQNVGNGLYATDFVVVPQKTNSSPRAEFIDIESVLDEFNQKIVRTIGFSISKDTDIFTTSPIITVDTTSVTQQQLVVNYRAAIEALSALLYEMSLSDKASLSSDLLLQQLANDLYGDDVIDNGARLDVFNRGLMRRDPMTLDIPNTNYKVSDIIALMEQERALTGDGSNIILYNKDIVVNLQPILPDDTVVNLLPVLPENIVDNPTQKNYPPDMRNVINNLIVTGGLVASSAASSPCTNLETIFCIDHDKVAVGHHVTDADITQWFLADQNRAGITNDSTGGAIDIVADPGGDTARGNVMRIFNSEGAHGFTDGINGPSSGQWRSWPGAHKELYFAFDFYMEPNRMWTMGQKLPGLLGGSWGVASGGSQGGLPDGTNGFSARMMMYSTLSWPGKGDGSIAQYTYYTDRAQRKMWYDDRPEGQIHLQRGRWYTLESYIKVNTPGVANGIMRAWVDGVQVLEKTNVMWRTVDTLKLDGVFFTFGYGGGSDIWNSPEDQYNYFDNWEPITH